jgi:hypothetical protein
MSDRFMQEMVGAWRYGVKPDTESRKKYNNALLSFRLPNFDLTIEGLVVWDDEAGEYTFCFMKHHSPNQIFGVQDGFAMYDKEVYEYLLQLFKIQFGIFRTNGMYVIPEHTSFFYDQTGRMIC